MIIYAEVYFELPLSQSLKDKRKVLQHLKDKIRKQYNVAMIEADYQDDWRSTVIEIVTLSLAYYQGEKTILKIIDFIESHPEVMHIQYTIERR
ncbi:MAG TPA: DUF503 domain-containing protein [Erysipelothrix sp.]